MAKDQASANNFSNGPSYSVSSSEATKLTKQNGLFIKAKVYGTEVNCPIDNGSTITVNAYYYS